MATKLLIRSYNVELGDCIYVRIPNGTEDFHILIDCGTKGKKSLVENAVAHLKEQLPDGDAPGKKRLDLLVATHRHQDHIKGFDPDYFEDIQIKNIWMSALMNPNHPQATKSLHLEDRTAQLMQKVVESGAQLSPEMEMMASLFNIGNKGAEKFLREDIPRINNIEAQYVVAGKSATDYGINLEEAKIRILGPEADIDGHYLGAELDDRLASITKIEQQLSATIVPNGATVPKNISRQDFTVLKTRMLSDAFAFADVSSKVTNNASVVLLIEWGNQKFLFVADTEWHGQYKAQRSNGGWNVMWNFRKEWLNQSMDFLKIGHHGSENATPWDGNNDNQSEVNQILEAILPKPVNGAEPQAKAIVSTERSNYITIPNGALMTELGERIGNTKNYQTEFADKGINPEETIQNFEKERAFFGQNQPLRTDFEHILNGRGFVDIEFEAK